MAWRARPPIPGRIAFAVGLLDLRPDDEVLEIGCGAGHAIALVADRLPRGARLTAIDRSATMIARARTRNADAVADGRVTIARQSLDEAAGQGSTFDRLFAINVNCFWTARGQSFDALQRLARPGATIVLAYEPPSRSRLREIAAVLPAAVESAGCRVTEVVSPRSDAPLLAVVARAARDATWRDARVKHG